MRLRFVLNAAAHSCRREPSIDAAAGREPRGYNGAMAVFLLTLGGIAIVMAVMAIGVLLDGRCLRGSCGGPDVIGPDGDSLACAACPRRKGRPAAG